MRRLWLILFVGGWLVLGHSPTLAQTNLPADSREAEVGEVNEEVMEGKVVEIKEIKEVELFDGKHDFQVLRVLITRGSLAGKTVTVDQAQTHESNLPTFQVGDPVVVSRTISPEGFESLRVTDVVRRGPLLWLFGIFAVLVTVISSRRGLMALVGMGYTFVIIFLVLLPRLHAGDDPVIAAIFSLVLIVPVTFYLTHGIRKKTHVAVAGTLITLVVSSLMANSFIRLTRLTGFASEEAAFVQFLSQGTINIQGLLLAGIMIGSLGILDDITVSQASVAESLSKTKRLAFNALYLKTLAVGNDHVASLVNTLILVYTGASLPLLLLFFQSSQPVGLLINNEIVAEEIVRTLVGSIGLVLAVPITTLIAAWKFGAERA